ncbi:MAG: carbonic anhydrase family protein [Methylotenera sp.]
MRKIILIFLLNFTLGCQSAAAAWLKLNENGATKLSIDKLSIVEKDQQTRAWVKLEYKSPQINIESADRKYNASKLLWHFDCDAKKSATSQVFQYLDTQLIYSAGIDIKGAEFIEPVPDTDLDLAMRYVCARHKSATTQAGVKPANKVANSIPSENAAPKNVASNNAEAKGEVEKVAATEAKPQEKSAEKAETVKTEAVKTEPAKSAKEKPEKADAHEAHWTYGGKEGPENWGKLKPEFATCDVGRNQSPINIEATIDAPLKTIRGIQKNAAKDIVNNGHTVQASFKYGNMLMLDDIAYQMKQVHFHAPSENTIKGKSFPLEAHFVHADSKGNLTVIGVMFKEGKANQGLEKLWSQMPKEVGAPIPLKVKVSANEMLPDNRDYYRFSGSLTTPPCSEGVRWLLLKTPMTASKEQIESFELAVKHHNNRPVQPLNGRLVIE